jgi:anti-anti-sigma factor
VHPTPIKADRVHHGDPRRRCHSVVVDLDRTTFIDSHCVAMLVTGFHEARDAGRGFALVRARGVVRRVLEVSGLAMLLGA